MTPSDQLNESRNGLEHELNLINNLNMSDLQSFGFLPKETEASPKTSVQLDSSIILKGKCKNFKNCKGEGNTNRYKVLLNHRSEKYCPFEAKVNIFKEY